MKRDLRTAAALLALLSLLTGGIYPLLVTGLAQIPGLRDRAGGQLLLDGRVVGVANVGQEFRGAAWFWGRPSAVAHNPSTSGGSNLAAGNPALVARVAARAAALRSLDPDNSANLPVDLVTSSGSGLDPHISLAGARWQAGRVARARGLAAARVDSLVEAIAVGRGRWGDGPPRVDVQRLNHALHHIDPGGEQR